MDMLFTPVLLDVSLNASPAIPSYQPIPLPAPLWLLQALLIIGFITHVIPMNVIMTGGLLSAWHWVKGGRDASTYSGRFATTLSNHLPVYMSVAITQGVVPLLFLQLLYGPLYYTSSVQMGWFWLSIIFLLLVGYYGLYIFKLQKEKLGAWSPLILILSTVTFWCIGFLFVNNITLMLQPDRWLPGAATNGLNLNLADPQLWPRFMHFLFSSFAVNGLVMGLYGYILKGRADKEGNTKNAEYASWLIKSGAALFGGITLVQIGIGGWFLMSQPRELMMQFMGGDPIATGLFGASMALTVLSLLTSAVAWTKGSRPMSLVTFVLGILIVVLMIGMRHMQRLFMTDGIIDPATLEVSTQWDLLTVFIILAVSLIVFLVWLIGVAWKSSFSPSDDGWEESTLVK